MRIENTARSQILSTRPGVARTGEGGFFIEDQPASGAASAAQSLSPSTGIDVLLALQAVDDPLLKKRKAMRRGNALLDALDAIQADLLIGRVSEGRLNQLMALVSQARERGLPEIDPVLDDIELRARVELAKFGRFTGP